MRSNKKARNRYAQFKNAPSFLDIPPSAKAHFLKGDLEKYFVVDFDYPARLICEPVGEFEKDEKQFVKKTIIAIEIIKIEKDYH
ncbi:MAG: hypothetical protein U9O66_00505 [Patescibacteria group bacterium]|nr:hypothetical protein [Patescibacteria group bacterium]